ncbi:MAG TPA: hybrid sensor histidine kinase/response regulator [Bacteroidetes bacterium]|mgnify:CR=1 FL=1|nr:hybrid sensor histidine kinase/response regulator [Bacteroidota bacterium]
METLRVLVVDDEPGIRSGIGRILRNYTVGFPFMEEDFDFRILEAETGEKALEIMEREPVDIVLLDNKLPGMDGVEVLEVMKQKKYDTLVMMITSYASLDLAVKATGNGAYNFVPKPFTPQELKTSVENITKHLYLKRMTKKMQDGGREERFQFLSVLSHELKSPINAVEGYLNIMLEKQAGDNIDDYRTMIERSVERLRGMRMLIKDLLDLTRYESGDRPRQIRKVDLHEMARTSLDTVEPLARQKKVSVHFDAPENLYMEADAGEIEIIFNNLLSNAVKYNKDGGEVFFTLKEENDRIRIVVEDTGIGMKKEDTEKLFHEFVRIRNGKTRHISGSGLGLSITKKFVELYNGEITVESEPDKGSTFTVWLKKFRR